LHGTDVADPRSGRVTRAVLPLLDLTATVSGALAEALPARARKQAAVLPCGVGMDRFRPIPRVDARRQLGLDPDVPCLLFPADPSRAEKRFDRAQLLAGSAPLHALGSVDPDEVVLWINAANAVVI